MYQVRFVKFGIVKLCLQITIYFSYLVLRFLFSLSIFQDFIKLPKLNSFL